MGHYECGDIVEQNGNPPLFEVVGVIHDEQRLFVRDRRAKYNVGDEFEIYFEEVTAHWKSNTTISEQEG